MENPTLLGTNFNLIAKEMLPFEVRAQDADHILNCWDIWAFAGFGDPLGGPKASQGRKRVKS